MSYFYFYDLPVYRLSEDLYYSARSSFVENNIFHPGFSQENKRDFYKRYPNREIVFRDYLEKKYGGCWTFNEIIGYIRLHFLGSQIRGMYFSVLSKKIVRTRKKQFEWKTWKLAPEIDIEPPFGNFEILAAVREYIEDCKKEIPKRVIDTSSFDAISQFINWEGLLKYSQQRVD